jgi:hypothetical protein
MHRLIWIAAFSLLLCALSGNAAAATLEPIGKFKQPIFISSDPGDGGRLLVAERAGTIEEISQGGVAQIADLSALVSCCEVERGLLSIAPAPDFGSSGRFYAAYTGTPAAGGAEGDIQIDSFRPGSGSGAPIREPILSIEHSANASHNGGQLQFGPDGHLYISLGDGGGVGDPLENGQDREELLGKILRIDPLPGQAPAYSIPATNPFVGGPGRDEIWAYGLRNPWRFSFDRLSGDMVIGDVGQGSREEVDLAPSPGGGAVAGAGANYGWNCREGLVAYSDPATACATAGDFTDPVFDYVHQNPADGAAFGCSIIGGYVVRDRSLGDLYGRYVYADYCVGQIRSLSLPGLAGGQASGDRLEGPTVPNPTSFGEDSCGRVYVASDEGTVYRLAGPTPAACVSSTASSAVTGGAGPEKRRRPHQRLRLRAKPLGQRFKIVVWVSPCLGRAGESIRLNQGGRKVGTKRLDRNCVARFYVRIGGTATFRALLQGGASVRSQRLVVEPLRPGLRR